MHLLHLVPFSLPQPHGWAAAMWGRPWSGGVMKWFPPNSLSVHKEMREEFLDTSAGEMDSYPRSIHWMAAYHLFTRYILHSSCDIKGEKWFLFVCCQRSDLSVTAQAAVQLIRHVHLQLRSLSWCCMIRNMCLATFPWTSWSCLATRIPENWVWHKNKTEDEFGNGRSFPFFPITQLFSTSICCTHSVSILAV